MFTSHFVNKQKVGIFMDLAVIGTNFYHSSIEKRDLVSFSDTKKLEMYECMNDINIDYGVIVSTCNRSEIYFLYEKEEQLEQMQQTYLDFFHLKNEDMQLMVYEKKQAIYYLFEVCAGIRSLVIGEDQILGQMVESVEFAQSQGKTNKLLNRIFQEAVTCAKQIRSQIKISEHPLSISYIGIQQLLCHGGISDKTIMVIGAGKIASLAMRYVFERNPKAVYNANRSLKNAVSLQAEFPDLLLLPLEKRYDKLQECDIVISATSCPHILLKKEHIPKRTKELICLDLAIPRDIDPHVIEDDKITLFNIDSLQEIANHNLKKREELVEVSRNIIHDKAKQLEKWILSSHVDHTIASLQEKCDEIVHNTYDLLERKLDLSEREKFILHKTLHTSMYRLMKEPFRTLKQLDEKEQIQYQKMVKRLFQMEDDNEERKKTR